VTGLIDVQPANERPRSWPNMGQLGSHVGAGAGAGSGGRAARAGTASGTAARASPAPISSSLRRIPRIALNPHEPDKYVNQDIRQPGAGFLPPALAETTPGRGASEASAGLPAVSRCHGG